MKNERLSDKQFEVCYGTGLKVTMIVCALFCVLMLVINVGNCVADWGLGTGSGVFTIVVFGAGLLLSLSCVSGVVIWRIKVIGDTVYYRNYFGITKKYTAKLDKVVMTQNHKIIVYHEGRRIFSIDNNLEQGVEFMLWCEEHVRDISWDGKGHHFERFSFERLCDFLFKGKIEEPGNLIAAYLIESGVALGTILFILMSAIVFPSELEHTQAVITEYEMNGKDMRVCLKYDHSYYEISGCKDTLSNVEEFEKACEEGRSFNIGYLKSGSEEVGIKYYIESLTDESHNVYVTPGAMSLYEIGEAKILLIIFFAWFVVDNIYFWYTVHKCRKK